MPSRPSTVGGSPPTIARTLVSLAGSLLLSLFFLEALRLFFAQEYLVVWAALFSKPIDVKGLVAAALMVLCFFVPLLLPLLRRLTTANTIALVGALGVSLARPLLSAGLPFPVEVVAVWVTIAFFGLFVPAHFEEHHPAAASRSNTGYLVVGFALALAYDMGIRALGTTVDLSLRPEWLPVQLVLSAAAISTAVLSRAKTPPVAKNEALKPFSPWAAALLLSALGPLLFLEYNLFMHASTVSRWMHVDYDLVAILLPLATVIGVLIPHFKALQRLPAAMVVNGAILLSVAGFLWYDGWISGTLLLVAQMCIVLDLRLLFHFASSHTYRWKVSTVLGVTLTTSLLLAFVFTFLLTLSFAYAYTFDMFRGTEPVSFFAAVLLLGGAVCVAAFKTPARQYVAPEVPFVKWSVAAIPVILSVVALGLKPGISPRPPEPQSIRILTYNLHQAFGVDNKLDLQEILSTIEEAAPDFIGLQEADGGRVPSMSVDEVLWLARRLNVHSAYGPSWGNTYGVATLSKYPIVHERRYLLSSAEQQRACLETRIDLGQGTLTLFSVHLGLNPAEREQQLDELLVYTGQAPAPKVLVGDFNAHPDSDEIQRVLEQFGNAFALGGTGDGFTSPAEAPEETIDYIFTSPDIEVVSAEVIFALGSDHLPVVAQIQLKSR